MTLKCISASSAALNFKNKGSSITLFFHGILLCLYIFASIFHRLTITENGLDKYEELKIMGRFRNYFFTGWNLGLQITFLLLAIVDEISKLTNRSGIQKRVENVRQLLFSTLVFPSSLLVMTIFWSIWHIDRELIFPKAIDKFYPSWLNHTLHTLIIVPLVVEVLFQSDNKNFKVSRLQAVLVMLTYSSFYKILYLSVYFQHGIWLYPIYKVLSWTQRIGFILLQFGLLLGYQQVGIALLSRGKAQQSEKKLM